MKRMVTRWSAHQSTMGCAVNSGPLSTRIDDGQPCTATSASSSRTTQRLGRDSPIALLSAS